MNIQNEDESIYEFIKLMIIQATTTSTIFEWFETSFTTF